MSQSARVESVDALRSFRTALVKFAENARLALTDAEADLRHTLFWVQSEQRTYWQAQVNKRATAVVQAKEALRQKQLFKSDLSSRHGAAEQEKALALARRALEEAEQKLVATRNWGRRMEQEAVIYRSLAQRVGNQAEICVPEALAKLDRMIASLDAYLALEAPITAVSAGSGTGVESQALPVPDEGPAHPLSGPAPAPTAAPAPGLPPAPPEPASRPQDQV